MTALQNMSDPAATARAAFHARRARFAAKAVPDDGILCPLERKRIKRAEESAKELARREQLLAEAMKKEPEPRKRRLPPLLRNDVPTFAEVVDAATRLSLGSHTLVPLIQVAVASRFNISVFDMLSLRRSTNVVRPRMVAMWLSKELTELSLAEIGRRFGRHHTTMLNAIDVVDRLRRNNASFADLIEEIRRDIGIALAQTRFGMEAR